MNRECVINKRKKPEFNDERSRTCCFTGHRPTKLHQTEEDVKKRLAHAIDEAVSKGYDTFITGMARGVDLWAAEIVINRRDAGKNIQLIAAVPFPGMGDEWSEPWGTMYSDILDNVDLAVNVSPYRNKSSFLRRNRWMVDRSSLLIAVFDDEPGGTRYTIDYAFQNGLEISII